MTAKGIILGLLGAVFIAAAGYLNDGLLRNTYLVGNHFPISVFGLLIVMVVAVNPLLGWIRSRWRFAPAELAVAITLMLAACSVPGSGFLRTFTTTLAVPLNYERTRPDWAGGAILRHVPPSMLPDAAGNEAVVIDGFLNGLAGEGETIGIGEVPWGAWRGPLATWLPLMALLGLAVICLSLIVHRQWSQREHLRYPIAAFATGLMGGAEGGSGPIYRQRPFWIGLAAVLSIHVVNGLHAWDVSGVQVPTQIGFTPLIATFPQLAKLPNADQILTVRIYPTVVAIGFLLAAQVSFSLGISSVAVLAAYAVLLWAGVNIEGSHMTGGVMRWQRFGSYVGMAVLIGYVGRHYYWGVARAAAGAGRRADVDAASVWACRILAASAVAIVAILSALGLDWTLAIIAVGVILMMFTVMARISAESGLFFCQPWWRPMAVFVGLFGLGALGPKMGVIIALLTAVLVMDPRECLMPFVVNAMKVCEAYRLRPARAAGAAGVALALALAVGVPVALWANYNYGMFARDRWAAEAVPNMTFHVAEQAVATMTEPQREAAAAMGPLERLASARPSGLFLRSAGAGLVLVLAVSALRLRFARFPLHPILFLVWGTYPLRLFCHSFLLAWLVKALVMKYGGGQRMYARAKLLMFGVIAGDLLGGLIFMIAGAAYYALTGYFPPEYRIFPG
ncbi:MAG TPA: DUF6785 family protein [Phycisphaerae bacterium]|nr:DUF6785 family protein [Phycisphaerae bacterium]